MTRLLHRRHFVELLSASAKLILTSVVLTLATTSKLNASPEDDAKTVAALDTKYQAAVKANDAATMDHILADNFALVTGRGSVFSKADLIDSARKKEVTYERQDEEPGTQKVRVWDDTAVVTALLWIKSVKGGKTADYKLWFSDTYVRTPTGWRYVFGQASLPLPKADPPTRQ
jgi:ketosteroid isomerase-like protein